MLIVCVYLWWRQATKVFVNGVWVGIHRDPATLVTALRNMRRVTDISTEVILQLDLPCSLCTVSSPLHPYAVCTSLHMSGMSKQARALARP